MLFSFQCPKSPEAWLAIAKDFDRKWNFPNCIGAIDGKHITIRPPAESGSYYYNYKGTHSIVLLAAVDANYKFLYVDVGTNGRVSDGGVWENCSLNKVLVTSAAGIPNETTLPKSNKCLPHVFVGDDAFPLKTYILKPYPFQKQTKEQRIFSYRLSRARRVVENAFGILANRFRVLLNPVNLEPSKVEKVVLACTALHNFLREHHSSDCSPTLDVENVLTGQVTAGSWRKEQPLPSLMRTGRRATESAKRVRDEFCAYFSNEGAVPWQNKMVGHADDLE
jgi:hypothetical protein